MEFYDPENPETGKTIYDCFSKIEDGDSEFVNIDIPVKYNLQGTTQGNGLTGGVPPVRFSMQCSSCRLWRLRW